jgi:hypothetical protein
MLSALSRFCDCWAVRSSYSSAYRVPELAFEQDRLAWLGSSYRGAECRRQSAQSEARILQLAGLRRRVTRRTPSMHTHTAANQGSVQIEWDQRRHRTSKMTTLVQSITLKVQGTVRLFDSRFDLVRLAFGELRQRTAAGIYLAAVTDSSSTDFLYQAGVL